jgi:hypothetical protein
MLKFQCWTSSSFASQTSRTRGILDSSAVFCLVFLAYIARFRHLGYEEPSVPCCMCCASLSRKRYEEWWGAASQAGADKNQRPGALQRTRGELLIWSFVEDESRTGASAWLKTRREHFRHLLRAPSS